MMGEVMPHSIQTRIEPYLLSKYSPTGIEIRSCGSINRCEATGPTRRVGLDDARDKNVRSMRVYGL